MFARRFVAIEHGRPGMGKFVTTDREACRKDPRKIVGWIFSDVFNKHRHVSLVGKDAEQQKRDANGGLGKGRGLE